MRFGDGIHAAIGCSLDATLSCAAEGCSHQPVPNTEPRADARCTLFQRCRRPNAQQRRANHARRLAAADEPRGVLRQHLVDPVSLGERQVDERRRDAARDAIAELAEVRLGSCYLRRNLRRAHPLGAGFGIRHPPRLQHLHRVVRVDLAHLARDRAREIHVALTGRYWCPGSYRLGHRERRPSRRFDRSLTSTG